MTRATLISLCAMVLAGATSAAAQLVPPAENGRAIVDDAPSSSRTPAPAMLAQSQAQAPRVAVGVRRRRGTFVGYVDDALIQSNVRIRFDAATGNTVPDRAEFFYAKCGCYRGLPPTSPGIRPGRAGPGARRRERHQVPAALSRRRSRGGAAAVAAGAGAAAMAAAPVVHRRHRHAVRQSGRSGRYPRRGKACVRRFGQPPPQPSKRSSTFRAAMPRKGSAPTTAASSRRS